MKIYLAGKMNQDGAWRDALLASRYEPLVKRSVPWWTLFRDMGDRGWDGERISTPWPHQPNRAVLDLHDYVGPYRTDVAQWESKNMGDFHGSVVQGCHGQTNEEEDHLIVAECQQSIARADLVFAYINTPDCFGTLAEIGMAKALGAFTVTAFETAAEWDWSDYWFTAKLSDATVAAPPTIAVGPKPVITDYDSAEQIDRREAWERLRDAERDRVRQMLTAAVMQWTARPEKASPLALVQPDESGRLSAALRESAAAFSQISQWTADPRVRQEAHRMFKRLVG